MAPPPPWWTPPASGGDAAALAAKARAENTPGAWTELRRALGDAKEPPAARALADVWSAAAAALEAQDDAALEPMAACLAATADAWAQVPLDSATALVVLASAALIRDAHGPTEAVASCACAALAKVVRNQPMSKRAFETVQPALRPCLHILATRGSSVRTHIPPSSANQPQSLDRSLSELLEGTLLLPGSVESCSGFLARWWQKTKVTASSLPFASAFLQTLRDAEASSPSAAAGMLLGCARASTEFPTFALWQYLADACIEAWTAKGALYNLEALTRLTSTAYEVGAFQPQDDEDGSAAKQMRAFTARLLDAHGSAIRASKVSSTQKSGSGLQSLGSACELLMTCLIYVVKMDLRIFTDAGVDGDGDALLKAALDGVLQQQRLASNASGLLCALLRESAKLRVFPSVVRASISVALDHADYDGIAALAQSPSLAATIAELATNLPLGQLESFVSILVECLIECDAEVCDAPKAARWGLVCTFASESFRAIAESSQNALRKGSGISLTNLSPTLASSIASRLADAQRITELALVAGQAVAPAPKRQKNRKGTCVRTPHQLPYLASSAYLYLALSALRSILAPMVAEHDAEAADDRVLEFVRRDLEDFTNVARKVAPSIASMRSLLQLGADASSSSITTTCLLCCAKYLEMVQPAIQRSDLVSEELIPSIREVARSLVDIGASAMLNAVSDVDTHACAVSWLRLLPISATWLDMLEDDERIEFVAKVVIFVHVGIGCELKDRHPTPDKATCSVTATLGPCLIDVEVPAVKGNAFFQWFECARWEEALLTSVNGLLHACATGMNHLNAADRVVRFLSRVMPKRYKIDSSTKADSNIAEALITLIQATVVKAATADRQNLSRSVSVASINLFASLARAERAGRVDKNSLDMVALFSTLPQDMFCAHPSNGQFVDAILEPLASLVQVACNSKKSAKAFGKLCIELSSRIFLDPSTAFPACIVAHAIVEGFFRVGSSVRFRISEDMNQVAMKMMASEPSLALSSCGAEARSFVLEGLARALLVASTKFAKKADKLEWLRMDVAEAYVDFGLQSVPMLDHDDSWLGRLMHRSAVNFVRAVPSTYASRVVKTCLASSSDDITRSLLLRSLGLPDATARAFDNAVDALRMGHQSIAESALQTLVAIARAASSPGTRKLCWIPDGARVDALISALLDFVPTMLSSPPGLCGGIAALASSAAAETISAYGKTRAITTSHIASLLALPVQMCALVQPNLDQSTLFEIMCNIFAQAVRTKQKACAANFHSIVGGCDHLASWLRQYCDSVRESRAPSVQALCRMAKSLGRLYEVLCSCASTDATQWSRNLSHILAGAVHQVIAPLDKGGRSGDDDVARLVVALDDDRLDERDVKTAREMADRLVLLHLTEGIFSLFRGADHEAAYIELGRSDGGVDRSALARWREVYEESSKYSG